MQSRKGRELGMCDGTNAPWRNEELLRQKYWDEGMTQRELAEEWDCVKGTIQKWMKRHGIKTRKSNRELPPTHYIDNSGYETIRSWGGDTYERITVHRLIAIAEGMIEPNELRDFNLDVHHKNNIPWDNRPSNLEVLKHSQHTKIHHSNESL